MGITRKYYIDEFKQEAVKLARIEIGMDQWKRSTQTIAIQPDDYDKTVQ